MGTKDFDIYESFKGLKINDKKDINILLLGETGIGKSTFINAVANYLSFKDLKKAVKEKLMVLIPSQIHVMDKNHVDHTIKLTKESDLNETLEEGVSATQDVKTYVFPIGVDGATKLRFIDTPGIGDTRGPIQDNINCENILSYIGELNEIHAICFLFNSNSSRITVFFDYCFKEILSRLDKSAVRNIIFIFTKSRGANFTPGETFACLRKLVENIKKTTKVDIPLSPKNMFCFENDVFRYLAAIKNGIELGDSYKTACSENWLRSTQECWRLISYIIGDDQNSPLKPHSIKNTISINEARRLIVNLSQPLADITQYIDDNIRVLQRHKEYLQTENLSLDQLRTKLYMPVINLKVTNLTQPVTVCANAKCAEIYTVESVKKWHYKQRCHDPCYLSNVPKEIVGAPELVNCAAIDRSTNKCTLCTCDYSCHMHVYYLTVTVNESVVDNNIQKNISNKEQALNAVKKLIKDMKTKKGEYEDERRVIVQYTAQFAHFLQENAITPFNDSYENYIKYLIQTEESYAYGDPENIKSLKRLLTEYKEIKHSLDNAMKLQSRIGNELNVVQSVTAKTILDSMTKLYSLPLTGRKIRELLKSQKTSRSKEHDKNSEYTHGQFGKYYTKKSEKDKKEKKSKKDGKKDEKKQRKSKDVNDDKGDYKNKQFHAGNRRDNSGFRGPNNQYPPRNFRRQPPINPPPYSEIQHGNYNQPSSSQNVPGNFMRENHPDSKKKSSDGKIEFKIVASIPDLVNSNSQETSKNSRSSHQQNQYYGGPNQNYGPPNQSYDPQNQNYGLHNQNYGHQNYEPQNQNPGPRNKNYGSQNQNYGPPNQNFGHPNQNYRPPNQNYGPQSQNYGPQNQNYGPQNQNYGPQNQNYGPQNQNYGPQNQDYGPPNQNYSHPNQNYQPQNQNCGPHYQNSGPQNKNFGPPNKKFGPPNRNNGPANRNHGPSNQNHGPSNQNHGPLNQNRGPPHQNYGQPRGQSDHLNRPRKNVFKNNVTKKSKKPKEKCSSSSSSDSSDSSSDSSSD